MEPIGSFGVWVRARRELLQLSRDALARSVGCAPITLRKIEADERRPSVQVAERLAAALGLPAGLRPDFVRAARAELPAGRLPAPAELDRLASAEALRRGNLPIPRTALIGRERELALLRQHLLRPDVALLTITGPPGVGKTRLSLHTAAAVADAFADGVWFVPLATVRDARGLVALIAQTLGAREHGVPAMASPFGGDEGARSQLAALVAFCRGKRALLVLDNIEQVAGAAPLLAELLAAAPQLKLLATSRSALQLSSEQEVAIAPLTLPDPADLPPLALLRRVPAVELFVQRAQAAMPDFALDEANAAAVAAICRRLDGLPLAIELAAARVKVLAPETLLARLESRLGLLTNGLRDGPAHHQTLRAAIDWSYNLLDDEERRLFRHLAVFRGGFELEAAEAICAEQAASVLDLLAALVNKSLVQQRAGPGGALRFDLLETVGEYALEQLAAAGELEAARSRHAAHYLQLARTAEAELQGPQQIAWLDRLELEHDNLRAALAWAQAQPDRALALEFGAALWLFWQVRGFLSEGRAWLDMALGGTETPSITRVRALNGAGMLAWSQSDIATANALCSASLELARELGDREGVAHALSSLATIATGDCYYELALAHCDESLAISRPLGLWWLSGWALLTRGFVLLEQHRDEQALLALEEGLALFRQGGGVRGCALALLFLAYAAQYRGDVAESERYAREAHELFCALRDWQSMAYSNEPLAYAARARGDYAQAQALLDDSMALLGEQGDVWRMAWEQLSLSYILQLQGDTDRVGGLLSQGLEVARRYDDPEQLTLGLLSASKLALGQGDAELATRLLAAADAYNVASCFLPRGPDADEYAKAVAGLREDLAEAFEPAWQAGQATPIDEAVAAAQRLCGPAAASGGAL